jgi:hypothetical protein
MSESKGSRLSQRVKKLLLVILIMIILIAVQPFLWRVVNESAEQLNQKRFQVKQINEIKTRSKKIEDEYEKQKIFLEQLTAVVPLSRDTLQVIERLEGLANELGVNIEVKSISEEKALVIGSKVNKEEVTRSSRRAQVQTVEEEEKDEPRLLPLVVEVVVSANASSLLSYIEAVEHVQELTAIRSFSLEPSSNNEGNESKYFLSMNVIFYLQDHETKRTE